ncbi:type II toxin-antitoxin system death-on-curing family toxin [Pleurocapsa sp. PCC 7319]|uniref:type II toxin-antitoxin system death-on-curing family toxin n=1 Tax=Pleurocapsa sp. PCC 7319 TaxID=118161 RepID=UPI000347E812|nr:type II toxin-antitoxin system death-on-curing family toxin [Pleurocapsa sp. PCC 7319]
MKEPIWVAERIVLAIHEDQLAQHGGTPGIRDNNLLGASLARPKHLFAYGDPGIFDLAAAYGYGLANNHPFIDGNKRTAFMVMYTFLGLNNYWLEVDEMEVVVKMEGLTMNRETQESITLWLKENSTFDN